MYIWDSSKSEKEMAYGAYWERNMLALKYADGWYKCELYKGYSRVLSLDNGAITFHIPDEFDVGNLQEIENNWDGHTTEIKWKKIMKEKGIIS